MTRVRCALAIVMALAVLGACSDDDPEPKISDPTPSVSSAPTTAATVSTSPTVSPALGPEETVRAWVAARNEALQDGDTADAEVLGSDSCSTCEDSLQPIRDVYSRGGHFETDGWSILASRIASQSDSKAKVSTGIEYAAGRTFPDADGEPVTYEAEKHVVVFRLVVEEGHWHVAFIGYLS